MRTRLSICARKRRYHTVEEVAAIVALAGPQFRHYKCDRCGQFHLTSRTKGKRVPREHIGLANSSE